ncbi:hypothetical protein GVX82_02855 [Patescibacteria group bacterium]|jgi:hypothetical protein|nr:hypothetical protein [Patescibacteria group bacterium]
MPKALLIVLVIALLGGGAYLLTQESVDAPTEVATTSDEELARPDASEDEADESVEDESDTSDDEEVGDAATSSDAADEEPGEEADAETETEPTADAAEIQSTFADGTYTATADYLTPRRTTHTVDLTLTLEDDVVTAAAVTYDGKPAGEYSNDYQEGFDAAYEAEVVGQPIENISLSRMGGSSLTPQGFNDALEAVKAEARA